MRVRRVGDCGSIYGLSLDVREGCEVMLVDCVSRECMDMELALSLSKVNVERAVEMLCVSGQR